MRSTDAKPMTCFRTNRYFCVSGDWYFTTRENEDFGPFVSREHAETALSRYLETQSIIHYLRGADPALKSAEEAPEQLVARLSQALLEDERRRPLLA
jgi:hypothetical protein